MNLHNRLVLNEVILSGGNQPVAKGGGFDVAAYSRMKYGHTVAARTNGYGLANLFRAAAAAVVADPRAPITVCGPATSHTPKPASAIAHYFTQSLSVTRVDSGHLPAKMVDIQHAVGCCRRLDRPTGLAERLYEGTYEPVPYRCPMQVACDDDTVTAEGDMRVNLSVGDLAGPGELERLVVVGQDVIQGVALRHD